MPFFKNDVGKTPSTIVSFSCYSILELENILSQTQAFHYFSISLMLFRAD